jgi:hypothetical protein
MQSQLIDLQLLGNHRAKSINFATGVLIQKWCRHQYIKALLPTLMIIWYFGLAILTLDYEKQAVNHLLDEYDSHNCSVIKEVPRALSEVHECSFLDNSRQYIELSYRKDYSEVTVNCTIPGANFYYEKGFWGVSQDGMAYEVIVNFLLPIIFTYFVYETLFLSLYDCLILIPGIDEETQKPVIRYTKGIFRVSWFILRDLSEKCFPTSSSMTILPGRKQPGIRVGYLACICINIFTLLTITTLATFGSDQSNVYRCTKQPINILDESKRAFFGLLCFYLALMAVPTARYYHQLFFRIRDIELLATEYSYEFLLRRHSGIRNIFDIFPLLLFPLTANIFYYLLWVLPNALLYWVLRGCETCLGLCSRDQGRGYERITTGENNHNDTSGLEEEDGWKRMVDPSPGPDRVRENEVDSAAPRLRHCPGLDRYFEKFVFDLDHRWWCSWFVREVDRSDCVGWRVLVSDEQRAIPLPSLPEDL